MDPAEITKLRSERYNATIVRLRKIHSDLMCLTVKPDFALAKHEPGQYSTLGLGYWEPRHPGTQEEQLKPGDERKVVRRAYSISCGILDERGELYPSEFSEALEFYIVLVRESENPTRSPALTPRLFMLKEGDRINLGEKCTGHYTLEGVNPTDTVLFLSTGTGEAPHNYMTWKLLKHGHQGPIVSVCCVRMKQDLAYASMHADLMKRFPSYHYIGLSTRDTGGAAKMYIQDLLNTDIIETKIGRPLNAENTQVFLCGNPKMIGVPEVDKATGVRSYPKSVGVIELLEKRGFKTDHHASKTKGQIHFEEYW
jgi:ferredoxin--NADP+ reductase